MPNIPESIGRYKVLNVIGRGGMGTVYQARDPVLDREVAIKVLRDVVDNESLARLQQEAKFAARLAHRNIVSVLDLGETDEGQPFVAMEFVRGKTLGEIIRSPSALTLRRKMNLMFQVCDGLDYAHRMGVLHRDIKPANIMVSDDDVVKILDFGLARGLERDDGFTGGLLGTPAYMAPEAILGEYADARSDIFSVGAVFYELLTYRRAFGEGSRTKVFNDVLNKDPASIASFVPGIDAQLVEVVNRCLAKNPSDRYQTLSDVRQDLERIHRYVETDSPTAVLAPLPGARPREAVTPTDRVRPPVSSAHPDEHPTPPSSVHYDPESSPTSSYRPEPTPVPTARSTSARGLDGPIASSRPAPARGGVWHRLTDILESALAGLGGRLPKSTPPKTKAPKWPKVGDQRVPELPRVFLSVSVPRSVLRPSSFTARFVAYVEGRDAAVRQRLVDLDPLTSTPRQIPMELTPSGGGRWRVGTPVMVRAFGEQLEVQPPMQSFEWNGKENLVSFLVTVLDDAHATVHLCFEALIEGVPVFFMPVEIQTGAETSARPPSTITAQAAATAFASYSSKDDAVVKQCLSALKHWDPHINIFMDCLDLTPNAEWQRELEQVIPSKDAFLLFWSVNSMTSAWVAWEIDVAASARGVNYIRPMPLDSPDVAPPPEKLRHLHFGDRYLAARRNRRWLDPEAH